MLTQARNQNGVGFLRVVLVLAVIAAGPLAKAAQFGPFDYYDIANTPHDALRYVEMEHFGPVTEQHRHSGDFCWYFDDLDYTLRAFPNHPGALQAVATFLESHQPCKKNTPTPGTRSNHASPIELMKQIEGSDWQRVTAQGYFERAVKFRPKRMETYLLYGRYLRHEKKYDEALKVLEHARSLTPESEAVNLELAVLYFDLGQLTVGKTYLVKARILRARAVAEEKSERSKKK